MRNTRLSDQFTPGPTTRAVIGTEVRSTSAGADNEYHGARRYSHSTNTASEYPL